MKYCHKIITIVITVTITSDHPFCKIGLLDSSVLIGHIQNWGESSLWGARIHNKWAASTTGTASKNKRWMMDEARTGG